MRARIRTVKPEVFLDEELWDLAQETGLPILQGFEGLWAFADKEGRFEWRPRALKPGILPHWDGDFSRVLDALTTRGFIRKYTVGAREFGLVRSFKKHQVINNREAESELPPPPADLEGSPLEAHTSTREARVVDASGTPLVHAQGEGKGREGKGMGMGMGEHASARPPTPPEWERAERPLTETIKLRFETRFVAARGNPPAWTPKAVAHVGVIAAWLGSRQDRLAALDSMLTAFFADAWCAEHGYPIGALAGDPAKYLAPPTARRDVRKGFVEPAPASAFTNPTNLDDVFGPEIPIEQPQPERFPRRRIAT